MDTSAILAIALDEPESEAFLYKIAQADACRISVGTWIELGVVVQRRHPDKAGVIEQFLQRAGFRFEAVSRDQAEIGREGYRQFGQAARHPARLNFGDCFAYALAKETGEPLLYKGDDFARTDILAA